MARRLLQWMLESLERCFRHLSKQADGLPKAETVQQFRREAVEAAATAVAVVPVRRLVSADLPLKVDRDALALDMKDRRLCSCAVLC